MKPLQLVDQARHAALHQFGQRHQRRSAIEQLAVAGGDQADADRHRLDHGAAQALAVEHLFRARVHRLEHAAVELGQQQPDERKARQGGRRGRERLAGDGPGDVVPGIGVDEREAGVAERRAEHEVAVAAIFGETFAAGVPEAAPSRDRVGCLRFDMLARRERDDAAVAADEREAAVVGAVGDRPEQVARIDLVDQHGLDLPVEQHRRGQLQHLAAVRQRIEARHPPGLGRERQQMAGRVEGEAAGALGQLAHEGRAAGVGGELFGMLDAGGRHDRHHGAAHVEDDLRGRVRQHPGGGGAGAADLRGEREGALQRGVAERGLRRAGDQHLGGLGREGPPAQQVAVGAEPGDLLGRHLACVVGGHLGAREAAQEGLLDRAEAAEHQAIGAGEGLALVRQVRVDQVDELRDQREYHHHGRSAAPADYQQAVVAAQIVEGLAEDGHGGFVVRCGTDSGPGAVPTVATVHQLGAMVGRLHYRTPNKLRAAGLKAVTQDEDPRDPVGRSPDRAVRRAA